MTFSISGVSGGTKQINVYKTTMGHNQLYDATYHKQFQVRNGSGPFSVTGVKVYLKKKGHQYIISFNEAARTLCNRVRFEYAGKNYYLSNGLDFTPSYRSVEEALDESGMLIEVFNKYQSYYPVENVTFTQRY